MKKVITLGLMIAGMTYTAVAQKSAASFSGRSVPGAQKFAATAQKGTAIVHDQLIPLGFQTGSSCAVYYYVLDTGYVAGTNNYGDKQKLMRYTLSDYGYYLPATVDTVAVWIPVKKVVGNGSVTAKVYSATTSGAPGTLLATSAAKTMSQIDTSDLTNFTFSAPVSITTSKFFVALDISALYATGDSLAIMSTEEDCNTTDTASAWEQFANGTYMKMADSWPIVFDMAIFPYVNASNVGVNNVVRNDFGAKTFPNPASDVINISFVGQDNGTTTLNFKDITGKLIATRQVSTVKAANYKTSFDVSRLSNGLYFVEIGSGNNKGMLKVSVQ